MASFVLQFLPDPEAFLAEVHRVLAPGAPAVVALPCYGWNPPTFRDARSRIYWLGRQVISYVPGAIRRWTEEEAVALLEANGFEVHDVTRRAGTATLFAYAT